jgi:hypothetical protein
MTFLCIKPACDSMECVACNCAVPDRRSAFEAFARRYTGLPCWQDKTGNYVHADIMGMWRAWCAAIVATTA